MFQKRFVEKKHTFYVFGLGGGGQENAVYEKMWKTAILPGRALMNVNMARSLCVLDS
jgi:hypothetical protein